MLDTVVTEAGMNKKSFPETVIVKDGVHERDLDWFRAEFSFGDGSQLLLIPRRQGRDVLGFDSAVLYQNGNLEAYAAPAPDFKLEKQSGYLPETRFFSAGRVTQQQLGAYILTAASFADNTLVRCKNDEMAYPAWQDKYSTVRQITCNSRPNAHSLAAGRTPLFDTKSDRFRQQLSDYQSTPVARD
jgi:hypothetical protein